MAHTLTRTNDQLICTAHGTIATGDAAYLDRMVAFHNADGHAASANEQQPIARDRVTQALWDLHEAAMDASNDPTPENIRAVDKAMAKVRRNLPAYYWERSHQQMAAVGWHAPDGHNEGRGETTR